MDITPFLEIQPAPRAVFARLDELGEEPRFFVPTTDGWSPVTWNAFAQQIRAIALWLDAHGFGGGDRACLYGPNRIEWGSAALAVQAAGGITVPIYPAVLADQLAYIVGHSDARVLFVDTEALLERALGCASALNQLDHLILLDPTLDVEGCAERARGSGASATAVDALAAKGVGLDTVLRQGADLAAASAGRFDSLLASIDLDAPGLMLYTSGTTGNPKGVPLTHRNVGINARDWLECNHPLIDERSTDLLWLPMSHIFGFGELCLGNTLGFCTYLSDPKRVLDDLPRVRPNVFMSVPAYWEKIAIAARASVDVAEGLRATTGGRLRFCLSGGAGLKREIKDLFATHGLLIIEGYGLTETSPTLTLNRPDDHDFDTVGRPLPSVDLRLADDGEIQARGPNVFGGYHKDPEATAAAFTSDGWFKTGDLGRFTDRGFLQIIGRKKEILVTAGGKNIPPANIELRFADDPLIDHLVVYGDGHKYLVAGVWLNPEQARTFDNDSLYALVQERIDRVNDGLARYETIKRFCIFDEPLTVESGMLTTSLKLRRKHIYERFGDQLEALYAQPDSRLHGTTPRDVAEARA